MVVVVCVGLLLVRSVMAPTAQRDHAKVGEYPGGMRLRVIRHVRVRARVPTPAVVGMIVLSAVHTATMIPS